MGTLILGQSKNGKAVFANKYFKKWEKIIEFKGKLLNKEQLITQYDADHSLRIDKNLYIGPSGQMDDFLNHSCNPNSGVKIRNVVAIKNIRKGEEISIDYSTFADDDDWRCNCGSKNCRKIIRRFKYIPKRIQQRYIKLGIVQKYILKNLKRNPE